MNRKALLLSIPLALSLGLFGCNVEVKQADEGSATQEATPVEDETTEEKKPEPQPEPEPAEEVVESTPLAVGETAQTDKFSVTLTAAYASDILQSSQSTTYWTPQDGAAFVVLEFDVTALTSDQLPVDSYALTDMTANYNGNTYQNWTMSYLSGQLWLYFMNTYLEANLPCHVYVYTSVPADVLNGGSLTVDMNVIGQPRTITVQ